MPHLTLNWALFVSAGCVSDAALVLILAKYCLCKHQQHLGSVYWVCRYKTKASKHVNSAVRDYHRRLHHNLLLVLSALARVLPPCKWPSLLPQPIRALSCRIKHHEYLKTPFGLDLSKCNWRKEATKMIIVTCFAGQGIELWYAASAALQAQAAFQAEEAQRQRCRGVAAHATARPKPEMVCGTSLVPQVLFVTAQSLVIGQHVCYVVAVMVKALMSRSRVNCRTHFPCWSFVGLL